jgi:hypothetical protein
MGERRVEKGLVAAEPRCGSTAIDIAGYSRVMGATKKRAAGAALGVGMADPVSASMFARGRSV